jgi:hypothetical protein
MIPRARYGKKAMFLIRGDRVSLCDKKKKATKKNEFMRIKMNTVPQNSLSFSLSSL